MAMGGAIKIANGSLTLNEKIILIQLFDQFIKDAWAVGSLFFAL